MKQFFQDESGQYSSRRLAFLIGHLAIIGINFYCIAKGDVSPNTTNLIDSFMWYNGFLGGIVVGPEMIKSISKLKSNKKDDKQNNKSV